MDLARSRGWQDDPFPFDQGRAVTGNIRNPNSFFSRTPAPTPSRAPWPLSCYDRARYDLAIDYSSPLSRPCTMTMWLGPDSCYLPSELVVYSHSADNSIAPETGYNAP